MRIILPLATGAVLITEKPTLVVQAVRAVHRLTPFRTELPKGNKTLQLNELVVPMGSQGRTGIYIVNIESASERS